MCGEQKVEQSNNDVGILSKGRAEEWQEFIKHLWDIFRVEVYLRKRADLGEGASIAFDGGTCSGPRFAGKYKDLNLLVQRPPIQHEVLSRSEVMLASMAC